MAEPVIIDPSAFTADAPASVGLPKIDPKAFKPDSKYPAITTPGQAAEGVASAVKSAVVPHDETQAWLTILGAGLPFVGKAAPLLEEMGGPLAKGASYLAEKGFGPMAARIGLNTAVGAATGGKVGALEGAGVGTGGEALGALGGKIAGVGTAENAAAGEMRVASADSISQKALENELGITAEQAQKMAVPEDMSGAQPLARGREAISGARQGAIREVGEKYEPIYGPLEDVPAKPDALTQTSQAAQQAEEWANGKGAKLSPATQKALSDLKGMAPPQSSLVTSQPAMQLRPVVPKLSLADRLRQATAQPSDEMTLGQLRGKLGQVMTLANSPASTAIDRRVLMDASQPIIQHLQDAVPEEQRPLLTAINNEYAQVNRIFPFKDLKKIQGARTLPELGEMFFSPANAPATKMAISRMTPEQQDLMRQAWGASILKDGMSPTETLSRLQANKDAVAALYPDSKFGKIQAWRESMVGQKKFMQGPPNLPAQKQFEDGLRESIKKTGLTPEAAQAATDALSKTGGLQSGALRGFGRYLLVTGPIMGMMGWGPYHHVPELLAPAAMYGAGMVGWKMLTDSPAALDMYRQFVTSGWTKAGGDAFGRLLVNAANDAIRGGPTPEQQAVGAVEPGPARKALDKSRANAIAPHGAASRASDLIKDASKGKTPEVHSDLTTGRMSLEEVKKALATASKTDASAMLDHVPLDEAMSAAEVGTPDEKKMLIPLLQTKMRAEMGSMKGNRTQQAKLAMRMQKLTASVNG